MKRRLLRASYKHQGNVDVMLKHLFQPDADFLQGIGFNMEYASVSQQVDVMLAMSNHQNTPLRLEEREDQVISTSGE